MLLNLGVGWNCNLSASNVLYVNLMLNNLTDCAYQNHLSRLKYTDVNTATGRQGIYAMGRNMMIKLRLLF